MKYLFKRFINVFIVSCLLIVSFSAFSFVVHRSTQVVYLGSTPIHLAIYQTQYHQPYSAVYYHPHADERTALQVTRQILEKYGGLLVDIEQGHNKTRLIHFVQKGKHFRFDPNRIFTTLGIKKTLKKYGPYTVAARKAVQKFADHLLTLLRSGRFIVAVHNNTRHGYSIYYYQKGQQYAGDARAIYRNPHMSPHSLVVVTDYKAFRFFKKKGVNAVLESKWGGKNDGSLSRYSVKHKIRYINVETLRGVGKTQYQILKYAQHLISAG